MEAIYHIYWMGVVASFPLAVIFEVIGLRNLFSLKAKNLSKIGLYYSIFRGDHIKMEPPSFAGYAMAFVGDVMFYALLSWPGIIILIYDFLRSVIGPTLPKELKAIEFKVSNTVMNEEQLHYARAERMIFTHDFNDANCEDRIQGNKRFPSRSSNLEEHVIPQDHKLTMTYGNQENGIFVWEYEYRITGHSVSWRLRERIGCSYKNSRMYHLVKDGVVQEDAIKNEESTSKMIENLIDECNQEVKWHEPEEEYGGTKYFILARGSTLANLAEVRTYFLEEFKRILYEENLNWHESKKWSCHLARLKMYFLEIS